jgi:hypothetical protein
MVTLNHTHPIFPHLYEEKEEEWHPVCMVTVIGRLLVKQEKHVLSRLS